MVPSLRGSENSRREKWTVEGGRLESNWLSSNSKWSEFDSNSIRSIQMRRRSLVALYWRPKGKAGKSGDRRRIATVSRATGVVELGNVAKVAFQASKNAL